MYIINYILFIIIKDLKYMKSILSFLLMFNCIYLLNTSSILAADIEAGQKIFTANCAVCHAGGENAIMPNKTLKIDVLDKFEMDSIPAITNQVKGGKGSMPSFQSRLNPEDIDNVANYVLTQAKQGWDED